ncbi:uncharacterized protein LOC116005851 [Ipomoea triloba]|uniref:uncharacterized protein LOC116005851 n=1 Tax=Ipomoea triloba TaxID=35885 RepID=UPI00125D1AB5|nr:uncharacterized protein LOC116005851 [Ipomoea triloba]
MVNGRCSKHFLKKFVEYSNFESDGYPIYRRRDDGKTITKNVIQLDNRYVVPNNRYLLLRYKAHMNVEWCNQSRSIKYLFKYVNKGNARITAEFYKTSSNADGVQVVDEINMYYDCRYVSAFEATCDDEDVETVLNKETLGQSMFTQWFEANKTFQEAKLLTYIEMPNKFYNTFKEACYARGLLQDDTEYVDAIMEASYFSTPYSLRKLFVTLEASHFSTLHSLRKLFVTLLMSNTMAHPEIVWEKVWTHLADDAQHNRRRLLNLQDIFLTDEEKMNFALFELSKLLLVYNKTLRDFPNMPIMNEASHVRVENRLLWEELAYDCAREYEERKTFLWRAVSLSIRAKGEIVINVASSGIASLLLPGGRTAHSRFSIPISVNEDSTCNINQGSQLAELIVHAKLIIWDEAPMIHKHCFEALDKTMRDLLRFINKDFGGKTVVLGGDFRQISQVVPKGSRQDIVSATINSSYLWRHCRVMRLTKNLRLTTMEPGLNQDKVEEFANWLISIGDGSIGVDIDGNADFDIPTELLLKSNGDPISSIVKSTFPNFTGVNSDGSCF